MLGNLIGVSFKKKKKKKEKKIRLDEYDRLPSIHELSYYLNWSIPTEWVI